MLKLVIALAFMCTAVSAALSGKALQDMKILLKQEQPQQQILNQTPLLRSQQSELNKLLGKWKVTTDFYGNPLDNYLNLTEVKEYDGAYYLYGTDSMDGYSSGKTFICAYKGTGFEVMSEDYDCLSLEYEGDTAEFDMYNWYFFNLKNSTTIEGVYATATMDQIDMDYLAGYTNPFVGRKEGSSSSSSDILNSNLSTLKNRLLSTKTYSVSGSFASYDFAGVDTAFDWAFVTPQGKVYQLQGNSPSANDAFGWKEVYVNPDEPAWYMAYLDDWDGDRNGKFDWILVGNGFDAVYKLEGVTATGNFAYSQKIDIEYSVSSDKKTITFGASSTGSFDGTVGPSGGEVTLPGGESATIPAGSTTKTTAVDFIADDPSAEVDEEMQSYLFTSDQELGSVNFSMPVTLSSISSADDLHAVYIREDGAMKTLIVAYSSSSKRATFSLTNNWTFTTLSPAGRSLRASSGQKHYILLMKKKAAASSTTKSKLISMPYYEQPGNSCWAASGKMLTHGVSTASKAHLNTDSVHKLMGVLKIGINDGFNGFYKGASLAKILDVNYKNYFLWSSMRKKMIAELDKGHPLIYSGTFASVANPKNRITHAVLIVGYEYDSKGTLSFVMHDSRNVPPKAMYSKMLWDDMQINQWLPTEAVTLFWSDTTPSSTNSKFTLGLPTHGQLGKFYFEGQKTDKFNSVRYYLQFTTSVSKGYLWSTSEVQPYPETVFRENVSDLVLQLPVYNSGSSSGSAFVSVEVYEKSNTSNKVTASESISVGAYGEEKLSITLSLDSLVQNLGAEVSECAVSIKLTESSTVSTWDIYGGFELSKATSDETTSYGCPYVYVPALDIEKDGYTNLVNILDDDNYIRCYYDFDAPQLLASEFPIVDGDMHGLGRYYYDSRNIHKTVPMVYGEVHGTETWYYESGAINVLYPCNYNDRHGEIKTFTEDGTLVRCTLYENDEYVGSCMPE
ncbi:MAG: papain-like cysteine protease family protein [Campylobacterota bacterium]|nr:papain-like cysteine protease family protein [Campylobacterota bacterium]